MIIQYNVIVNMVILHYTKIANNIMLYNKTILLTFIYIRFLNMRSHSCCLAHPLNKS